MQKNSSFLTAAGSLLLSITALFPAWAEDITEETVIESRLPIWLLVAAADNVVNVVWKADVEVSPAEPSGVWGSRAGDFDSIFTFTRAGNTTSPLTVSYTLGGTADGFFDCEIFSDECNPFGVNGYAYDYVASSESEITFPAGSSTVDLGVWAAIDSNLERPSETIVVTLSDAAGYRVGTESSATARILETNYPKKLIFVTAAAFPGALGGVSGADAKCMADSNRPDNKTYKALLLSDNRDFYGDTANGGNDWVLSVNTQYFQAEQAPAIGKIITRVGSRTDLWFYNGAGAGGGEGFSAPGVAGLPAGARVWVGARQSQRDPWSNYRHDCGNWLYLHSTLPSGYPEHWEYGSTGDPYDSAHWLLGNDINDETFDCVVEVTAHLYCAEQ
jgi:Protein of unknown function (DUF1554)